MPLLTFSAILFIITAVLHVWTPFQYKNYDKTVPVAIYGVIYLALGILLLLDLFTWTATAALVLTTIGAIAAVTQINAVPEMRPISITFIVIDVVIIGALAAFFLL